MLLHLDGENKRLTYPMFVNCWSRNTASRQLVQLGLYNKTWGSVYQIFSWMLLLVNLLSIYQLEIILLSNYTSTRKNQSIAKGSLHLMTLVRKHIRPSLASFLFCKQQSPEWGCLSTSYIFSELTLVTKRLSTFLPSAQLTQTSQC